MVIKLWLFWLHLRSNLFFFLSAFNVFPVATDERRDDAVAVAATDVVLAAKVDAGHDDAVAALLTMLLKLVSLLGWYLGKNFSLTLKLDAVSSVDDLWIMSP